MDSVKIHQSKFWQISAFMLCFWKQNLGFENIEGFTRTVGEFYNTL